MGKEIKSQNFYWKYHWKTNKIDVCNFGKKSISKDKLSLQTGKLGKSWM